MLGKWFSLFLGHTSSSLAEAEEVVDRGAFAVTHLFNEMLLFHER